MSGAPAPAPSGPRRRGWLTLAVIGALAAGAFAGLVGLGVWQLQRRVWKLQLIAQVQARAHAPPAPPPGPAAWPRIDATSDAYRHVRASGTFRNEAETRVTALTDLGAGYWVLTPLRTQQGFTVLVNRGFVPADQADPATRRAGEVAGPVTVTGLLRVSEPRGSALQRNDPAHGLWYSRDVAAIAAARGLGGRRSPLLHRRRRRAQPRRPAGGRADGDRLSQQPPAVRRDLVHRGGDDRPRRRLRRARGGARAARHAACACGLAACALSDCMSMTKRYFTSPFSMRS